MTSPRGLRERMEMPGGGRHGLTLVLGASPLPNLLAILALRPSWVAIVSTTQVMPAVPLLLEALDGSIESALRPTVKRFGPSSFLLLADAYRPSLIRRSLLPHASELAQAALFYTGGTKPMTAHVHEVWSEHGGAPQLACYLADEEEKFLFDDGYEEEIPVDLLVSLETLASLHGLTKLRARSVAEPWIGSGKPGGPGPDHLKLFVAAACLDPGLCDEIYRATSLSPNDSPGQPRKVQWREAKSAGWCLDLGRHVEGLPALDQSLSHEAFATWVDFVRGGWLDLAAGCFLFQAAQQLSDPARRRTFWDIFAELPGERRTRDFQLDAAQVAGARLYAISCTTHSQKHGTQRGLTKLKVFEVLERARQLGGDLARSAVLSLHDDTVRDEIQRDFPAPWEGDQRKPRVFGISDLRSWWAGDLTTLLEWLRA